MLFSRRGFAALAAALCLGTSGVLAAPAELRIDYATYNPLSLVIKDKGWLEEAFKADKLPVRWVQSLGSNKALEFLNAGSIDIGSTAGAASLIGRVNGNPIKVVGLYSRPEWTALVERKDGTLTRVADLKGKAVAVTRGTDPHIFLVRALDEAGLTERDVRLVLLQHGDGKTALIRGDVDAWAGLDPIMAQAEIEDGAKLFYRKPEANTWGVLNAREDFAGANPEIIKRVLKVYEDARRWALAHPDEFKALLVRDTKLSDAVIAAQLARTDLSNRKLTPATSEAITAAGLALQKAGVIKPETDVRATVGALIDGRYELAGQ